jgi:hypothetical protein
VTPDTGAPERAPRPSARAIVLGAVGVLAAGSAVAALGFFAAKAQPSMSPSDRVAIGTHSGQLGTLPLHDEKPMRAIGKGVASP